MLGAAGIVSAAVATVSLLTVAIYATVAVTVAVSIIVGSICIVDDAPAATAIARIAGVHAKSSAGKLSVVGAGCVIVCSVCGTSERPTLLGWTLHVTVAVYAM